MLIYLNTCLKNIIYTVSDKVFISDCMHLVVLLLLFASLNKYRWLAHMGACLVSPQIGL